MSSHYVARFLSQSQFESLESCVADGTAEELIEEWMEDVDNTLCIGDSTDAWVYMSCVEYLRAKGCWPDMLATPERKKFFIACNMISLFIANEDTAAVIKRLRELRSEDDGPIPHIRQILIDWKMDGYVQEIDVIPEPYLEFLTSFEQHMQVAQADEKSLIVFVPY